MELGIFFCLSVATVSPPSITGFSIFVDCHGLCQPPEDGPLQGLYNIRHLWPRSKGDCRPGSDGVLTVDAPDGGGDAASYSFDFALGAVHCLGLEDFASDALAAEPRPPEHDGRCDEDRGISSNEDATRMAKEKARRTAPPKK